MKSLFKKKAKGILALLMTIAMLMGACLPAGALYIEQSVDEYSEPCWSVSYADKTLSIEINAEIVYNILKDRKLTKEELKLFVPEDILAALEEGRELTQDELAALAAKYITLEDLKQIYNDMPREIFARYMNVELFEELIEIDAFLDTVPFDDIVATAKEEALRALLTPEVSDLLFTPETLALIADEEYVSGIVKKVVEAMEDETNEQSDELTKKIVSLITPEVVTAILEDPALANVKESLENYILSAEVGHDILTDEKVMQELFGKLLDFTVDEENPSQRQTDLDEFLTNKDVEEILLTANALISPELISALIDNHVIDHNTLTDVFESDEILEILENGAISNATSDSNVKTLFNELISESFFIDELLSSDKIPDTTIQDIMGIDGILDGVTDPNDEDAVKATVKKNILESSEIKAKLADILYTLVTSDDTSYDICDLISEINYENDSLFMHILDEYIDHEKFHEYLVLHPQKTDTLLSKLGDHKKIVHSINHDDIYNIIHNSKELLFSNEKIITAFISAYEPLTNDDIMSVLGGHRGILLNYCDIPYVIENVVGYENLWKIFRPIDVINTVGIDTILNFTSVKEAVVVAGGAEEILKLFTPNELIAIVRAIGAKGLYTFVVESGILENMNIRATATEFLKAIYAKSDVKGFLKSVLFTTSQVLTNDIESITLGHTSNPLFFIGTFDLNSLVEGLVSMIPLTEDGKLDFANVLDNGLSVRLALVLTQLDENGNQKVYDYKINIGFTGDRSGLKDLLDKFNEYVEITFDKSFENIDGSDILTELTAGLDITVPTVFSTIYAELLNNEFDPAFIEKYTGDISLSPELREKLLRLPSMTLSDARDLIDSIAGDNNKKAELYDSLMAQIEVIREKAYSKLPEKTDAAKAKIDEYLDKLATRENFDKVFDKASALLGKLADSKYGNTSLVTLYENGGGAFCVEAGKYINIKEEILERVSLPDKLAMWFADYGLTINLNTRITVNGLHKLTITDENGETFTTLVPEGTKISVIEELTGNEGLVDENANSYGEDAVITGDTDASTSERPYVRFHYTEKQTTAVAATFSLRRAVYDEELGYDTSVVFYSYGDETIEAPDLENETWTNKQNGYHYEWDYEDGFKLGGQKVIDVYYKQTPNTYTVTFLCYDENNVLFDTRTGTFPFDAENVTPPSIDGYDFVSQSGYVKGYFNEEAESGHEGDQTVTVFYDKDDTIPEKKVTITFELVDLNGITIKAGTTRTYDYGITKTELSGKLNNDGYFLISGYTLIDITGYDPNGGTEQNVTVVYRKAHTDPETVTITFLDENGNKLEKFSFRYGISADEILEIINADKTTYKILHKEPIGGYRISGITGYVQSDGSEAQTVTLQYTGNPFTVIWKDGDTILKEESWTFGDSTTYDDAPSLPTTNYGHTAAWDKTPDYTKPGDITINVIWTPNQYTITFVGHDGEQKVKWDFGTTPNVPEVPYKYGHSGVWEDFSDKLNTASDFTVNAVYTLNTYTATFIADGEVVGTVDFTVNDTELTEPAVPDKSGYTGKWEEYTITDSDLTINAVYTPVAGGDTDSDTDTDTDTDDTVPPSGKYWGWIGLILVLLVIAGGLFGYFRTNNKDDEPTPDPEPTPEPEPEEEPEEEPEPVIPVVESVTVEEADELMSDTTAMKLIHTKKVANAAGLRVIINIEKINGVFNAGDTVTLETLKEKKLISPKAARVKILADGNLDKPLNIEANAFSVQAVKMITLTGGTVTLTVVEK